MHFNANFVIVVSLSLSMAWAPEVRGGWIRWRARCLQHAEVTACPRVQSNAPTVDNSCYGFCACRLARIMPWGTSGYLWYTLSYSECYPAGDCNDGVLDFYYYPNDPGPPGGYLAEDCLDGACDVSGRYHDHGEAVRLPCKVPIEFDVRRDKLPAHDDGAGTVRAGLLFPDCADACRDAIDSQYLRFEHPVTGNLVYARGHDAWVETVDESGKVRRVLLLFGYEIDREPPTWVPCRAESFNEADHVCKVHCGTVTYVIITRE